MESSMKVLVVDVGGTRLKILATATPMHSWEDFAFGRKPLEGIALNPN